MKPLAILTSLLIAATPALAQDDLNTHFFDKWDLNQDGRVTVAEALEHRGEVFSTFDTNGDNQLDAEEYTAFDAARAENQASFGKGFGTIKKDGTFGMSLRFNDLNKDSQVSREEFISRAADWVAIMDFNVDGVISSEDFRQGGN